MHRWIAPGWPLVCLLVCLSTGLGACVSPTDPLGRQDALEEAQKRYTDYVRWGELEKAGSYVDPALREDFLGLAKDFAALRITDFEVGDIHYAEDAASVTVVYKGYQQSQLVERTAREEQEWYREEGIGNTWRVRPQLALVLATLQGRRAAEN